MELINLADIIRYAILAIIALAVVVSFLRGYVGEYWHIYIYVFVFAINIVVIYIWDIL